VQFSLRQWLELIAASLGADVEIVAAPLAFARPVWHVLPTGPLAGPHTLFSNAKAKRELGYADVITPHDALSQLVTHLAERRDRTDSAAGDEAAERAVIDALDRTKAELARRLGWDDSDEPVALWHPYDHPKQPGETPQPR
jgi:hypothetical protein